MGIYTPYGVPRRVKDAVDQMGTDGMADLCVELGIPTFDMPESDLYDWLRQRIFDWLYDPDWSPPEMNSDDDQEANVARESTDAVEPRRGDEFHAWLTRMRDLCERQHLAWTAVDWLVGDYERRADGDLSLRSKDDRA